MCSAQNFTPQATLLPGFRSYFLSHYLPKERRPSMYLILAVVLVLLWVGSFTVLHVTSFLIHLLLIFAVISIVMHFISGRRTA
jgi:amino acid permease